MKQRERFKILLGKYLDDRLSSEDKVAFYHLLESVSETDFSRMVDEVLEVDQEFDFPADQVYQKILASPSFQQANRARTTRPLQKWYAVAAACLLLGLSAVLLLERQDSFQRADTFTMEMENDILLPTDNIATLSFANGQQLAINKELDSLEVDGLLIERVAGDMLSLKVLEQGNDIGSYRFSTPKGASYNVSLPDGSSVWLNTGSSLVVDSLFNRHDRNVRIDGEAYFDVVPDVNKPFIVETGHNRIEVLGTQFNVHAYPGNSQIETTLSGGVVRVIGGGKQVVLKPGQQSVYDIKRNRMEVRQVDLAMVTGWKDGYFMFDNRPISQVLEMLGQWYDIEDVQYLYAPTDRFTGSLTRSHKLSDVLRGLEMISDMKFEIEERRVIITK